MPTAPGPRPGRPTSPSPSAGCRWGSRSSHPVAGWPYTEASLVFADRVADEDTTLVSRLRAAGAVLAGQTTSPEFGSRQLHPHQAARDHAQPVGSGPDPGGLLGGIVRRRGRRPPPHRQRQRRWRLHPDPGRLHRPGRAEVHLRSHPPGPGRAATAAHRRQRLPVALGARHGPVVRRVQRLRPPRHPQPSPGGGVGGRPRLLRPGRQAGRDLHRPRLGHRRAPVGRAGGGGGRGPHRRAPA